jgi:hypothetical protein
MFLLTFIKFDNNFDHCKYGNGIRKQKHILKGNSYNQTDKK